MECLILCLRVSAYVVIDTYRTGGKHWREYLDVIERALERAAPLPEETVPAVLLWSRLSNAVKSRRAGERTGGA